MESVKETLRSSETFPGLVIAVFKFQDVSRVFQDGEHLVIWSFTDACG